MKLEKNDTPKKDINKSFEKETAIKSTKKSATGKPLDQIIMNPQQKNVNTQSEDAVVNSPVLQERKALTVAQRQKRSRILRSELPKIERAREVAKHRLASDEKIKSRAMVAARNIVKKRFAARKGVDYATLSTPEKIQVDRIVDKKIQLVKKIASRLLPSMRKAEATRLQSFMKGAALKDITTPNPAAQGIMPKMTANESFEQVIADFESHSENDLIKIIETMIKEDNTPFTAQLQKMLEAILPKDAISESLQKKAAKSGIEFSTLHEVYTRGLNDWKPIGKMTQEQYAFSRVNSYISAGKAYKVDSDLHEEKTLDSTFSAFVSSLDEDKERLTELSSMSKEKLTKAVHDLKTRGVPEKKLKMIAKKKYMKATEKSESLDESFNIAYASGIGVTLTSADLGMQMKGAFALHPSVIEEEEDPCWDGYKMVGMKKKGKKKVPNCVPEEVEVNEEHKVGDNVSIFNPGHSSHKRSGKIEAINRHRGMAQIKYHSSGDEWGETPNWGGGTTYIPISTLKASNKIKEEVTTADVKVVKVAGKRKADGTVSPPHWAKIKKARAIIKSGDLTDGETDEDKS